MQANNLGFQQEYVIENQEEWFEWSVRVFPKIGEKKPNNLKIPQTSIDDELHRGLKTIGLNFPRTLAPIHWSHAGQLFK